MGQLKDSVVYIKVDVKSMSSIYQDKVLYSRKVRGSGYCIEYEKKKYIITNWHVIVDHEAVYIRDPYKELYYKSKVLIDCIYIDLAILECPKELNLVPLRPAKLPSLLLNANIYGYPVDGYSLTATKGVISRFEILQVGGKEWISYLTLRMDVSAFFGNSGGPVLNDQDEVIGTVNAINRDVGHVTFCIPTFFTYNLLNVLIRKNTKFLIKNLGIDTVELTDNAKKYLNFKGDGALISRIHNFESLKVNDIIMSINGIKISSHCKLKLSSFLELEEDCDLDTFVHFNYYVSYHSQNHSQNSANDGNDESGNFNLEVWRDSKIHNIRMQSIKQKDILPLTNDSFFKVDQYNFAPLSRKGLVEMGSCREFVMMDFKLKKEPIVMASSDPKLPCSYLIVKSLDDVKIKDFKQFLDEIKGKKMVKVSFRKTPEVLFLCSIHT